MRSFAFSKSHQQHTLDRLFWRKFNRNSALDNGRPAKWRAGRKIYQNLTRSAVRFHPALISNVSTEWWAKTKRFKNVMINKLQYCDILFDLMRSTLLNITAFIRF